MSNQNNNKLKIHTIVKAFHNIKAVKV